MTKLTYDQINALDGTELNDALWLADGGEIVYIPITEDGYTTTKKRYNCPPHFNWQHGVINRHEASRCDIDYRHGDSIDRIMNEMRQEIEIARTVHWCATVYGITFTHEYSIITAILRAWLWYMQEVK